MYIAIAIPYPETMDSLTPATDLLTGRTILVVDDMPINVMLLCRMLSVTNASIFTADSGETAIEQVKDHPEITLILMDIKMPGIDGLEATRIIRSFRPDIMVVAQTAYAFAGDRERALSMGCAGYLSKPYTQKELLKTLAGLS
jgi:CheY-like chemotaxis protein